MLARLLLVSLAVLAWQQKPVETQRELYPDGTPRLEREVTRDTRGQLIVQGASREWHANGQLAAKGRYTDGAQHGVWETWHANGERASKGRFERGARKGKWSYWGPDGADDLERTGEYELERIPDATGLVHALGYRVDGRRQGPWRFVWPDGSIQFTGRYRNGVREGPWVFFHQDGARATLLLSGLYQGGTRARLLEASELAALEVVQEAGLEVEPPSEAPPQPAVRLPVDWTSSLQRLEAMDLADPVAVRELGKEQPSPPILAALGCQTGFGWSSELTPVGLEVRREVVRSLRSLWQLKRNDAVYWWIELKASPPAVDALVSMPPLLPEDRPGYAESRLAKACFAGRFQADKPHAAAVDAALDWLARHQRADGSWRGEAFMEDGNEGASCTCTGPGEEGWHVGLSALALLAFLGDGQTPYRGEHRAVVARGLGFLMQIQDPKEGSFISYMQRKDGGKVFKSSYIYDHLLATYALAEAAALTGLSALEQRLAQAVKFTLRGQNPYLAWRYEIPPNGENDTSVTAWAIQALRAAEEAGVSVDRSVYDNALAWIDEATEMETGRCGYNSRGSLSSRFAAVLERYPADASEAMTAAALMCRILLGQERQSAPVLARHAELVRAKPPIWDLHAGRSDFYYWFYGAHAMHLYGDPRWPAALEHAVIARQQMEGDLRGSWDPIDAWSSAGGRVYATAILALSLEAPTRIGPIGARSPTRR